MSTPPPPPPPPPSDLPPTPPSSDGLQFDQAEFDHGAQGAPATACSSCQRPIADTYFEANGQVLCPACKESLHSSFTSKEGASGRFLRALMFGVGAAVLSAIGYLLIIKISGMNLAIATIAMGWFVGIAVRKGANYRGGALYQLLAVFLTYLSIAYGDPELFDFLSKAEGVGPFELITVSVITLALPVLHGMNSPISLLIYGFGLFQAWQMNRRPVINVSGPYHVGAPRGA